MAGTLKRGRHEAEAGAEAGGKHCVLTPPGGKGGNAVWRERRVVRVLGGRCLSQRAGRDSGWVPPKKKGFEQTWEA